MWGEKRDDWNGLLMHVLCGPKNVEACDLCVCLCVWMAKWIEESVCATKQLS